MKVYSEKESYKKEQPPMKRKYPLIDIIKTGQRIKQIMRAKGLTVRDLQDYLELATPQSIYHWFDGRNLPSIDNMYALSRLFGVRVDDMLVENKNRGCDLYREAMNYRVGIYYQYLMKMAG